MRDFEHLVNLERVGWPMQDGTIYWFGVGDYVRNKARTETGEIVAIDQGYAWVRVSDKKRVSIALSDLEPAPKPLQVGERVKDPDGFIIAAGTIVALHNKRGEACVDYGAEIGLVVEELDRLVRA